MKQATSGLARRAAAILVSALLAIAVIAAVPTTAQAGEVVGPATAAVPDSAPPGLTWDDQTGVIIQAWECPSGDVCFWTGPDGTGSRCNWDVADPDWATGNIRCSWALTTNVKSIWNHGTSSSFTGVVYYKQTGYSDRVGCTRQGQSGNLAGTYKVRSHRWTTGSCG